jgi:hypothetical protein
MHDYTLRSFINRQKKLQRLRSLKTDDAASARIGALIAKSLIIGISVSDAAKEKRCCRGKIIAEWQGMTQWTSRR